MNLDYIVLYTILSICTILYAFDWLIILIHEMHAQVLSPNNIALCIQPIRYTRMYTISLLVRYNTFTFTLLFRSQLSGNRKIFAAL